MEALTDLLSQSIVFMLPVWAANIVCNLLHFAKKHFKVYDAAADLGRVFYDNNRIVGEGITWIGLILCFLSAGSISWLQGRGAEGILLGLGVWLGGGVGSFIKRRFSLSQGDFFPILDHSDYVIGAFAFYALVQPLDLRMVAVSLFITLVFHPVFCVIGYFLGIKDHPW